MNVDSYPLFQSSDGLFFSFKSWGPKGGIRKIVQFAQIAKGYYILAFGDYDSHKKEMDDLANSNNGDLRRVMGTILTCVEHFFERHPEATLYFQGSTQRRTRFYQWIIARNQEKLHQKYYILGKNIDDETETIRTFREYTGFEVRVKSNKFDTVEEPQALYLLNWMMRQVVKIDCQLEDLDERELQRWLDNNSTKIMFPAKVQASLESLGLSGDSPSSSK